MSEIKLVNYVGYCGLYCKACGINQGKIKAAVDNLHGLVASYGFDKIMPELAQWEPRFNHYKEFEQVMNGLVKMFGDCPGCLQGGGDPNCKVRSCAKQKDYRTCTECSEAEKCDKLAPYQNYFNIALKGIKQDGITKFAEEMQKKVDEGYTHP